MCLGAPQEKLDRAKVFEIVGDQGVTDEYYQDGTTFGRRIYKPDGSLFSDKSVTIGVETDAVSIDDRPIKVRCRCKASVFSVNCFSSN